VARLFNREGCLLLLLMLVVWFSECYGQETRPEQVFTLIGFKSWKHAIGKKVLVGHSNSISHKESMVAWEQHRINSKRGTLLSK